MALKTFSFILALMLAMPLVAKADVDPALAGKQAEIKIKTIGNEAIEILEQAKGDKATIQQGFESILTKNFDVPRIARFAMGRYWSVATPAEQKKYTKLFSDMIVEVYADRFSEYSGQSFEVTGNKPAGRDDVLVNSIITGNDGQPVKVDWRVRGGKIIDVIVAGVSMSVTQRSEFASIIQRGGGEVSALITHLEK